MEKSVKKFTGYTERTEQFLWGISLNNNREWFLEHKQEYTDSLYEPTKALTHEVWQRLEGSLHFDSSCRCSRIYRDARRLHGRGPYKDRMWFTISRSRQWVEEPVFYFEIRPDGAEYGLGCYDMKAATLERMRRIIDANPARVESLLENTLESGTFTLYGEDYKRPKGVFDSSLGMLYNKKKFGFTHVMKWGRELMSKKLPERMAQDFKTLVPMMDFMLEFTSFEDE